MIEKEMNYKKALSNFIDYIYDHIDEPLLLEQALSVTYVSKFHFYRLFKAVMALPVEAFIKKVKLQNAARDLIHTDQSILEIALHYDFSSHEVFSRNFKKNLILALLTFVRLLKLLILEFSQCMQIFQLLN